MGIFDWKHWTVIPIVVVLVLGPKTLTGLGSDACASTMVIRNATNHYD
ncbi:twin-arginine translocase TatA/TatE family subunit, partial [Pseudomonas syringae]